ncbi:sodium/calcium exchanger 2-like isoform X4 [Mercenaria mercenaria]|uniref:sodium/calcium exchanger 2-like isoform X4 n=1 Tax=Mercenaria mercenaria TaxID=6596 RepID=UPI00234E6A9D|nr:sodium/calcium exchanger 2-like isoform X4 [Mercenaria mercenaria]
MYKHYTNYSLGYVVEYLDSPDEEVCASWLLLPAENLWHEGIRGTAYLACMFYFFVGIAIASDIFMSSIESLTSKQREVAKWDQERGEIVKFHVRIWNETVANLTLMALGSSAPEILLATIETAGSLGKDTSNEDSLGTFTIIGSAAFNLLIITAVCIASVPNNNVKQIREFGVFILTAIWSMLAYVWMLIVVGYWTPGEITPWEAWITLGYMPLFVFLAYLQDKGWCCKMCKDNAVGQDEQHMRILNQRGRAGSFTGHILPKELRMLEQEKAEKHSHTKLSLIDLNETKHKKMLDSSHSEPLNFSGSGSEHSSRTTTNITVVMDPRYRDGKESDTTVIEMNSQGNTPEHVERHAAEPQAFARARFRHAIVATLRGTHHKPKNKHSMSDVVDAQMKIKKQEKEGKKPEGDLIGKFTFSSDRYAVLESAGFLEVDILFHRNIPPHIAYMKSLRGSTQEDSTEHSSKTNVPNGDAVAYSKNGNVKINPESDKPVPGVVSVEYETREGTAKTGKDFRYVSDTLIFKEDEYRKTISVPIVNDNQFENDVMFYILLKNPTPGTGTGDPSVATVTIVDDDNPGEFQFDEDHCIADLSEWKVTTKVIRDNGFDGVVSLEYATIDGTAVGGKDLGPKVDYISQKGTLEFGHAETSKAISIDINKDAKLIDKKDRQYQGPKNFIITLKNPSLGAKIGTRSAIVCNITKDELGDRLREIVEEEEEEATWKGQFVSAMTVGGDTDDDGNDIPPSWTDYLLHFLTFFWKLVGACVPPTRYWGAWPTFVFSLLYIALLTMVVEQLGHLIGCVIGLKTSVTGITIIALGTSLPDTFASRTAAKQDEHADAAIGNVTGSNSVNVFLGLGIPWVLSTMYHLAQGTTYRVASDNLTQSVIIFSTVGTICIIILILRRKFVGGELGGKNSYVRWGSSLTLFGLWCLYILLASLKAYDILKWEV